MLQDALTAQQHAATFYKVLTVGLSGTTTHCKVLLSCRSGLQNDADRYCYTKMAQYSAGTVDVAEFRTATLGEGTNELGFTFTT